MSLDQQVEPMEVTHSEPIGSSSSHVLEDEEMEDVSQGSNNQQASSLSSSDGQQMMQTHPLPNAQISPAQILQSNDQDSNAEGAKTQDSKQHLDHMNIKNIPTDPTNKSDSQSDKASSSSSVDVKPKNKVNKDQGSHTGGTEINKKTKKASASSSSNGQQKNMNTDTAGYESLQPSAPQIVAEFEIKVEWTGPLPHRWENKLHKALQTWLSSLEGTTSVHNIQLMSDELSAKVQITPSTAVETLKKLQEEKNTKKEILKFKDNDKEVAALIYLDDVQFVTLSQTSTLEENGAQSPEVNSSSAELNNVKDVASNRAQNESETTETAAMTLETSATLTLPLSLSWYMQHVFKKDVEHIQKQHGVSICEEVSVLIKSTKNSSPDSVSNAIVDFQDLVQRCLDSFSDVTINHNDMDSDTVKQAIHAIQKEDTKMMFTMSASDCLFFGPKKYTDVIKRDTTRVGSPADVGNKSRLLSPQIRPRWDMDTKELPTHLEMDKVYWDLMKLSYKEQLSQLESKYGVSFNEEKTQKNVIKVQARSKGGQNVNLESHALRALTHLYQKLASAAVSCELTKHTHKADVAPMVEKLQQQHYGVVAADVFSPWKLVGLPEHLGPAIADIEKKHPKVFNGEKKKLIGYSGDIPLTKGIKWNQVPDYGPGAVGGAVWDERGNLRSEADGGFNEESEGNSRHDSKGAHTEEETCSICMDSFDNKEKLKCGHEFCRQCIKLSVKSLGSICPICKEVFGKLEGNQPFGNMTVTNSRSSLPGYQGCGTIEITYNIPSGIQTDKHPNPGMPYHGANRCAYLPDNNEGKEVLALLQRAFHQKLVFTVGKSTTSGLDNVVTWNDIHHKTSKYGGPASYGYPDPDYLKRVKDELKAKGIK